MPLFGSAVSTVAVAAGPVTAGDLGRRDTHLDAGEGFTSARGGFTVAVRSTSPSGGAVLDVSLTGGAPTGTAPIADPTARTRPVPQVSGYDYSVGEPAILGSVPDTAGASYDKACTGGYAIAGDSGFFLTTAHACRTGISADGSIRGDAGYHGDIYYSNPRDPLSLMLMCPGNNAHRDVINPITGARPGSGLVTGSIRSVDQPAGYVMAEMGIYTGWTEGKVVGTARGPNGSSPSCTTARLPRATSAAPSGAPRTATSEPWEPSSTSVARAAPATALSRDPLPVRRLPALVRHTAGPSDLRQLRAQHARLRKHRHVRLRRPHHRQGRRLASLSALRSPMPE